MIHEEDRFYDHVFYPSRWKLLFLSTLFMGVPAFCLVFLFWLSSTDSYVGFLLSVAYLLFVFFILNFSRKLAVGINQEGVYTWHLGFIPWKDVRCCMPVRTINDPRPVSVSIHLRDADTFLSKADHLGRRKRFLFVLRGKKISIPVYMISAKLPRLIELLKSYQQEARAKELTWPMDML